MGDAAVLDDEALATLRGALGDDGLMADVIEAFLQETPAQVEALDAAGRAGDEQALGAAAHLIKGSALTLGAVALAESCAAVESSPGESAGLVPAVGRAFDEAARSLSRYRAGLG